MISVFSETVVWSFSFCGVFLPNEWQSLFCTEWSICITNFQKNVEKCCILYFHVDILVVNRWKVSSISIFSTSGISMLNLTEISSNDIRLILMSILSLASRNVCSFVIFYCRSLISNKQHQMKGRSHKKKLNYSNPSHILISSNILNHFTVNIYILSIQYKHEQFS